MLGGKPMQEYKGLSEDKIFEKVEAINSIQKRKIDEEYIAMKNELNSISAIKNNYIIVLFTGLIAFWVCVLTSKESVIPRIPFVLILPQFFIYIIQVKLLSLADLHIRIQALIWTTYKACYEHNYIYVSKMIYGPRKQTVTTRIKKIPAFYMGIANITIVLLMTIYIWFESRDRYLYWITTLIIVIGIQIVFTVKFWNSRNGELHLISYAEQIISNQKIIKEFKSPNINQDGKIDD